MRYSPTSINTWMLCPRKFYYKYIVKLPEYPNIHSVKGKAVHKVLENMFYGVKYIDPMKFVKEELNKIWNIETVEISKEDEAKAKQDAINILELFAFIHQKKIEGIIHNEKAKGLDHAWNLLRPKFREKRYKSEDLLGIVDKEEVDYKKRVSIIDYKTSHKYFNDFKEDDERQTRLYALMYYREHKKLPDFIKINYLRFGEVWPIRVTPDIIKLAEIDLETVKLHTQSIEEKDYPKKPTKLCDWCSFKKECFKKENKVDLELK